MTEMEPTQGLDIDRDRQRRSAEREASGQGTGAWPIRLGGKEVAALPVELPVQVLAPLRDLDREIALLIRSAMRAVRQGDSNERWDGAQLITELLVANPDLPTTLVDVIEKMCVNLVGQDGFDALKAENLSFEDIGFLVSGGARFYGLNLGESSPSSDSSTESQGTAESTNDGETSSTTSSTTSDSTPETSSPTETPSTETDAAASSAPAAS